MPTDGDAVAVAVTSTELVPYNKDRSFLMLVNDGDTTVYVMIGAAAVLNTGIPITPKGNYLMNAAGGNLDKRLVNAIHGGTGTKVVTVTEYP